MLPGDDGVPDFGALQQAFEAGSTGDIVLYLFDLPYVAGHDLRAVALESRRAILHGLLQAAPDTVRFSEVFDSAPRSVLASACKLGLEGVIAKRRDSPYVSRRSADWIKLKCRQRQAFVIGGYTDPQGARDGFGALLLGVHDDEGALRYAGKVGSGFDQAALTRLRGRLDMLPAEASPFARTCAIAGRPLWVQPRLVAEVSFSQWTRDGHIRHPVFHALHSDPAAARVVREKVIAMKSRAAPITAGTDPSPVLSGVRVTHPQRVIDASTGATKIELLRHYGLVGALMMEHIKNRPVALLRASNGVGGETFFQKHADTGKLRGIRPLDRALDPSHPAMLTVRSKQGLLSAAQWNVIEFHTLNSGIRSFAHPDRMVFDLDPGEGVTWTQVREGAQLVHAFLTQLGLAAFLKTSGGKGLHLVVPLRTRHDWDRVKGFSRAIVRHLAATIPQRFVATSGSGNRVGRIFIDYLRNGAGASTVCAWSARARPGLGISVPVDWSELHGLRAGDHWTLRSVHTRLDQGNAPWAGYAGAARGLTAAMKKMGYKPGAPR